MVCVTQLVQAEQIGVTGLPVIVTQHANKLRQDIDLIHRFGAPALIREIIGIFQVGGAVQPMTLAIDIDARLIHG